MRVEKQYHTHTTSGFYKAKVMIKIAIQSKGRLNEDTTRLLADAGITLGAGHRQLISRARGFDMEALYLRDDDIPQAVSMGVADAGIVGLNEVEERGEPLRIVMKLGFGACRLSLAVPKDAGYDDLRWFDRRRVATSYPRILSRFFDSHGIRAEIHEIAGSVEVAPAVGMADAIFDIVSSGGTLLQNGLTEVHTVMQSEAVLVAPTALQPEKERDLDKLCFRFRSIIDSRGLKYVVMNIPATRVAEAAEMLPAMKSPTVLPLADPAWSSLGVVIPQDELWDRIEQLKQLGAQDILVLALENIVR